MIKIKALISIIFAVFVYITGISKAEEIAALDAKVIYGAKTNTVELTYTSVLQYPTTVMIMMTEGDNTPDDYNNIIKIEEKNCPENETVKISIDMGEHIEEDKIYNFYAYVGGYEHLNGRAQKTGVKIWGTDGILDTINAQSADTLAEEIYKKAGEILLLETINGDVWRNSYLINMKNEDFSGSFKSLEDVRTAWIMSGIIYDILSTETETVKNVLINNKEFLKFNIEEMQYKDEVCRLLKNYCKSIDTILKFNKALKEAEVVSAVNMSDNKGDMLKKYTTELGISELMEAYGTLNETDIISRFNDKIFENANEVKLYLEEVIKALKNPKPFVPSYGGGGGGGGGGSKPSSAPVSAPVNTVSGVEFNDMDSSHWAMASVRALSAKGIINGYDDGSFRPDNKVTREEFVKMIAVAFDINEQGGECDFEDISEDAWFKSYVCAAVKKGIIKGISDKIFGAGQSVKRQDAAVILDRVLIMSGIRSENDFANVSFDDCDKISDYAYNSICRLTDAGIINGINGRFEPETALSRAQAAKLIYGSMQYSDGQAVLQ